MIFLVILILITLLIITYRYIMLKKIFSEKEKAIIKAQTHINELQHEIASINNDEQIINMALNIIQKNEMLEKIRRKITKYSSQYEFISCQGELEELDLLVFETLRIDKDREIFKIFIEKSNSKFYKKLNEKYTNLTNNEQRLCALIRLNLSSKEISNILNITEKSVEMNRYRLRKKIQIPTSESLSMLIKSI